MARPNTFINRFRYAILAILIVATIGYSFYLYRLYVPSAPPSPPPSVAVGVLADGSVVIDGVTYTQLSQLKPKVAEIQKSHPGAGFSITAPRGDDFNGIAKAVVLLRQAGAETVWVINDLDKKGAAGPEPKTGFISEPSIPDNKK